MNDTDKEFDGTDWLDAGLQDTLDEDFELEMSEPALSLELRRIYNRKHPETLDRAVYFRALITLQAELIKLQDWVEHTGAKTAVIFEGRDAAGKGSVIRRISQRLNARVCRVVALPKPSDRENTQWYFQRYVPHLPSGGEIVLFDRSWYDRSAARTRDAGRQHAARSARGGLGPAARRGAPGRPGAARRAGPHGAPGGLLRQEAARALSRVLRVPDALHAGAQRAVERPGCSLLRRGQGGRGADGQLRPEGGSGPGRQEEGRIHRSLQAGGRRGRLAPS